jgi:hypothetical protein
VPRIDCPRIAAEEASHRRIVLAGAEVVLRGRGVEALAGVEVGIDRRAGLGVEVTVDCSTS